jgi:hypothetical protein
VDIILVKTLHYLQIESKFMECLCSCRVIGSSLPVQLAPHSCQGGR